MNIKILYDNEAAPGFQCGWGFAALIDGSILFDTGEDAAKLLSNMAAFGVEPLQIKRVVLSHADSDHVGGIGAMATFTGLAVYTPVGLPRSLKEQIKGLNPDGLLFEVVYNTAVSPDAFVTARLGSDKKEISLCVRTTAGLVLITGCAHPGLENIMAYASQFGSIHAVIGGFHGFSKLGALADVPLIVPCHCTRKKQEILDMYPEQARPGYAGLEMTIGEHG